MDLQHDAKQIIDRSLQTVLPDAAVRRALEEHPIDRGATVIAIGKAALAHGPCCPAGAR